MPYRSGWLACGVAAGPLFVASVLVQACTRDGFDLGRHPASLLALGAHGWLQVTTFVLTGVLFMLCAFGFRQALHDGWGGTVLPAAVAGLGAGLIIAGVFRTDPGAGFPPGAPEDAPDLSWHGLLHEVGFAVAQIAWAVFALAVLRRALRLRRWRWVSALPLVAVLLLLAWPSTDGISARILAATAVEFAWVAVLALRWRYFGSDLREW